MVPKKWYKNNWMKSANIWLQHLKMYMYNYMFIDKLANIINEYNNAYRTGITMKPVDVNIKIRYCELEKWLDIDKRV